MANITRIQTTTQRIVEISHGEAQDIIVKALVEKHGLNFEECSIDWDSRDSDFERTVRIVETKVFITEKGSFDGFEDEES